MMKIPSSFLWLGFIVAIWGWDKQGIGQEEAPHNGLAPRANRTVSLPEADWPEVIDSLSRTLDAPIVSFVPERWPRQPFHGETVAVLNELASQVRGKWSEWEGRLVLWPSWVVGYLQAPEELQRLMRKVSYKPEGWKRFLLSLSEDQMALFQQGRKLAVRDLSEEQKGLLKQMAAQDNAFAEVLPSYLERGELACYVKAGVAIFIRGKWTTLDQFSTLGKVPFRPTGKLLIPPWEEVKKATDPIVKGSGEIIVETTQAFSLTQVAELVQLLGNREFKVAAQVKEKLVVVSADSWDPAVLLTFVQVATQTELRQIDDLVLLAPSRIAQQILGFKTPLAEAEVEWQHLSAVIGRLCESPASKVEPVPVGILLDPVLVPYPDLTPIQKKWANREAFPGPPPPDLQESEEVECYLYPSVVFEFTTDDPRQWKTRAFSPSVNYPWLVQRTVAKLALER